MINIPITIHRIMSCGRQAETVSTEDATRSGRPNMDTTDQIVLGDQSLKLTDITLLNLDLNQVFEHKKTNFFKVILLN